MPHRHQQPTSPSENGYPPSRVRNEPARAEVQHDLELVCLSCGDDMRHMRTIPRLGVLPDLFVFSCPSCRSMQVVEPVGVWRNAHS
jgi:hypothetical protein